MANGNGNGNGTAVLERKLLANERKLEELGELLGDEAVHDFDADETEYESAEDLFKQAKERSKKLSPNGQILAIWNALIANGHYDDEVRGQQDALTLGIGALAVIGVGGMLLNMFSRKG